MSSAWPGRAFQGSLRMERALEAAGARVVIVLAANSVVGVNDLRRLRLSYRLRLRRLVNTIGGLANVEGVFLPAVAIPDAPMHSVRMRLQRWPLKFFLTPVCHAWEREKWKALFSADLMHPSPAGYEWWAKALAEQIRGHLDRPWNGESSKLAAELIWASFPEDPVASTSLAGGSSALDDARKHALRKEAGFTICVQLLNFIGSKGAPSMLGVVIGAHPVGGTGFTVPHPVMVVEEENAGLSCICLERPVRTKARIQVQSGKLAYQNVRELKYRGGVFKGLITCRSVYLKLHLLPFADFPFASATMSNDDLESGRRLEHSESVLCIGLRSRRFLVLLVVASQLLLLVLWRSGHVASLYMKQVGHKEPFAPDSTRLSAPPRVSIPANAERHDMGEVIRHHGQTVEHPSSHFTMFDVKGGMFAWLKSRGEQFVQDIFHETLDVCREDMSPDEAWERAVVLDIGSNTGFYGLLALEKGCAVVFVEPQPECNALISWSIRESGLDERKVKRVQQPVGRKEDGAKSLAVRADNHCSGRFPIENAERGHKDAYGSDAGSADSQTALQIPFLPVSDMLTLVGLSDSSKIQLIKIDTEGNELQILEAMLPILQHWQVSNMVVEVTPMWWRHTGYTTQSGAEIFEQLVNFGFVGSTIRGHSLKDAAAMRRYILHGKIYQDDLWLQRNKRVCTCT
ncbi:sad, partial [Symbiodinium pilosum]